MTTLTANTSVAARFGVAVLGLRGRV